MLDGVGPTVKSRLVRLGLRTIRDLLRYRPRRYESPAPERRIADLSGDEDVAIAGEIVSVSERRRGRLKIAEGTGHGWQRDGLGHLVQPTLARAAAPAGNACAPSRPPGALRIRRPLLRPERRRRDGDFAPVYPASEDVTPKKLRELVGAALVHARDLPDPLPAELKQRENLPLRADALWALHRPRSEEEAERGRRRLAFDELLALQLGLLRRHRGEEDVVAPALDAPGDLIERYRKALPFELTPDQEGAIAEIDADLGRTAPMQRLLQGDVGSGKTVVALYALLRAVEGGYRGALMAPTETLAEQHFLTVEELCRQIGVSVGLLTSSVAKGQRDTGASILVGTHALIQEGVDLSDLAVAVIDEQHRFGVEQRKALRGGAGGAHAPHDCDADPAHARADRLRRPRGQRDRPSSRGSQACNHELGHAGAEQRGVPPPLRAPRGGPAGLRDLPAHLRVGDDRGARGRGGG